MLKIKKYTYMDANNPDSFDLHLEFDIQGITALHKTFCELEAFKKPVQIMMEADTSIITGERESDMHFQEVALIFVDELEYDFLGENGQLQWFLDDNSLDSITFTLLDIINKKLVETPELNTCISLPYSQDGEYLCASLFIDGFLQMWTPSFIKVNRKGIAGYDRHTAPIGAHVRLEWEQREKYTFAKLKVGRDETPLFCKSFSQKISDEYEALLLDLVEQQEWILWLERENYQESIAAKKLSRSCSFQELDGYILNPENKATFSDLFKQGEIKTDYKFWLACDDSRYTKPPCTEMNRRFWEIMEDTIPENNKALIMHSPPMELRLIIANKYASDIREILVGDKAINPGRFSWLK